MADTAAWVPYNEKEALKILHAVIAKYQDGKPPARVDIGVHSSAEHPHGGRYEVDVGTMKQYNSTSGFVREIRVVFVGAFAPTTSCSQHVMRLLGIALREAEKAAGAANPKNMDYIEGMDDDQALLNSKVGVADCE
eukprot:jgi/Mesvir1/7482/Mv19244-RA.1